MFSTEGHLGHKEKKNYYRNKAFFLFSHLVLSRNFVKKDDISWIKSLNIQVAKYLPDLKQQKKRTSSVQLTFSTTKHQTSVFVSPVFLQQVFFLCLDPLYKMQNELYEHKALPVSKKSEHPATPRQMWGRLNSFFSTEVVPFWRTNRTDKEPALTWPVLSRITLKHILSFQQKKKKAT